MEWLYVIQQIINALALGSMLGLLAIGYTMIYGVLGLINFAHGEIFMIGAFVAYFLVNLLDIPFWLAFIVSILVTTGAGVLIERIAYRPVRGSGDVTLFITSLGASIGIRSLFIMLFGDHSRPFPIPKALENMRFFGDLIVSDLTILIFIVTIVTVILLTLFIQKSRIGIAMRATSYNLHTAEVMGINTNRIIIFTFAIGSALAAISGMFWGLQFGILNPSMGFLPGLAGFIAAVAGGIGNVPGAMISGFIIGIGQVLFVGLLPSSLSGIRPIFVWAILFLILFLRPSGLFKANIKWEEDGA